MSHKVEEYAVGVLVIGRSVQLMEEFQRGGQEDLSRKRYSTCLGRRTDLNTVVDLSMNFEQIRDRNHALLQRYRQETVESRVVGDYAAEFWF
jgi:hypothetical protein